MGTSESPTIFFPFVGIFGGLAEFIASLDASTFKALDTIIDTMWGAFWISRGRTQSTRTCQSWQAVSLCCVVTWHCALAATARELVLCACMISLAIDSTIACCQFAYNSGTGSASGDGLHGGVTRGIKAASYFWMFSALCAWCRSRCTSLKKRMAPVMPL
ncbi:Uu.00g096040.m01.CDS01 [Anthostomella pinea]|uniref:Uu.00g096040.m01.CDS01 n=1 Tax=Anthostomella pinea TaxID=933095 RepID=A0AAI8VD50_9PEZI|nr:Uu.00g096040.m01.CDS01 [Anthostomella pinea]